MEEKSLQERLRNEMPEVYHHGERTAFYALTIAREMGLSESNLEAIKEAAILHDVGKLFVSQDILNKAGELTEAEKAEVDRHHGEEVLSLLDFESPFARYVAEHHHDDNHGMLPECKIIAVADAFDALTTPRCYRDPLVWDEAIETLQTDARNANLDTGCINALRDVFARERQFA